MFHLIFDAGAAGTLTAAMDLDPALEGEIVVMTDDLSIGPLATGDTVEARSVRSAWWAVYSGKETGEEPAGIRDEAALQGILVRMEVEEFDQIWIWVAANARDLSGYFWLMSRLQRFAGRVFVAALSNLPFINEKGAIFYPTALAELTAREFVKARRLVRPVSAAEAETDPDEWAALVNQQKNLRIWEGARKLSQQADDFYDDRICKAITGEWQKLNRIVHQFRAKSERLPGESFVAWRLNHLQATGLLDRQGEGYRLSGSGAGPVIEPQPLSHR